MKRLPSSSEPDEPRDIHQVESRREIKYELDLEVAEELRRRVEPHLPCYEFRRGHPRTFITTVYFDTDCFDLYRRASASYDDNLKIRVKEYYYLADEGCASGPRETFPYCFVEIKRRENGLVMKRRLRVPKRLLNRLISGEDVFAALVQEDPGAEFDDSRDVYAEIRRHLALYSIRPRSIIHYRRRVYQENEDQLRITFDDQLKVFAPPPGLYESVESMCEQHLGEPTACIQKGILEIKCQGEHPVWLQQVMRSLLPGRVSKFTTSMDSVSGQEASFRADVGGINGHGQHGAIPGELAPPLPRSAGKKPLGR
jgi:SPX domain protein involved in polyphosphate accumulation